MDRRTTWAVLLTAVGIVAVAVSAATIPSPAADSADSGGGNATGPGIWDRADVDAETATVTIPFVLSVLVGVVFLVGGLFFAVRRTRRAIAIVLVLGVAGLLFLAAVAVLAELRGGEGEGGGPGSGSGSSIFGSGTSEGGVSLVPLEVVPVLVAAVVIVGVAVLYGATGNRDVAAVASTADADGDDGTDAADLARAAGRAADRIEAADAGADNEVYRAWREMTDLLEVANPRASTPGEFADAAVAAGMGREDVTELTALFEEVRYGELPASREREARAVETLRRIEETYAGGD